MKWLDNFPLLVCLIAAIALGLAPLMPEPHLWQKIKMLVAGQLRAPLDIFDLLWHSTGIVLLVLKLIRLSSLRRSQQPLN